MIAVVKETLISAGTIVDDTSVADRVLYVFTVTGRIFIPEFTGSMVTIGSVVISGDIGTPFHPMFRRQK